MSIEAMKLALEAIEDLQGYRPDIDKAIEALRAALSQQPAQAMQADVTDSMIREAFLANGFTIKDGHSDLKPYVYAAARAILALRPAQVAAPMSEIDIEDDDSLRFVQRVLESDAPKEDRQSARDMVVRLRKRVRKAHHG